MQSTNSIFSRSDEFALTKRESEKPRFDLLIDDALSIASQKPQSAIAKH